MVKVALLIGVSEFADAALAPLPAAIRDSNAVQSVLNHAEMGGFDEVRLLENPDRTEMEEAIDALFRDRHKDDLVLLYFSGHGIKDDTGKFSLATRITEKHRLRTTAVAASFVHDVMSSSRSRRQVVILDCCFSGAFATGMMAKDDSSVDIKAQLGGEGRAVLTASTATQYAFAQADEELSVYMRFLVEGIRTGAADTDNDGHITVDELHEYAQRKVQEVAPAMKPEIYVARKGYTIQLAKASLGDPQVEYRKAVEKVVVEDSEEIHFVNRRTLDEHRKTLRLPTEIATKIEAEVLQPYRERQEKLQQYGQSLTEIIQQEQPLSSENIARLKRLQQVLKLRDEDIASIELKLLPKYWLTRQKFLKLLLLIGGGVGAVPAVSQLAKMQSPQPPPTILTRTSPQPSPVTTSIPVPKVPLLVSTKYSKLESLLQANQWKEADQETLAVMLKTADRRLEGWLDSNSIRNFPCTDLIAIDQLWVKYSNGRFGFSRQKQIYLESGGKPDVAYDEKAWQKFVNRVGWRVNNTWIDYSKVTFNTTASSVHLPTACGVGLFWVGTPVTWCLRFSSLVLRLVKCNL